MSLVDALHGSLASWLAPTVITGVTYPITRELRHRLVRCLCVGFGVGLLIFRLYRTRFIDWSVRFTVNRAIG